MRQRLRRVLGSLGGFGIAASVFTVVGILVVLLEIQSSSFVMWDGIKVTGYTKGGVVYYDYRGDHYTTNNDKASPSDQQETPTTVWLDRNDPTDTNKAYIEDTLTRWFDFGFTLFWFVLAVVFVIIAILRHRMRLRRRVERMGTWGNGLSDEVVRRMLERQRGEKSRRSQYQE